MSRKIDTSNPKNLSASERKYLQDRGRLPKGLRPVSTRTKQLREEMGSTEEVPTEPNGEGEGPENTDDTSRNDQGEDSNTPPQYDDMTKAELKEELARRELPVGGKVAELIERLEEDDEADLLIDDEDEED